MTPVRWGVLGVSGLVGRLAVCPALQHSDTADFVAIASRDPAKATAEAARFGARRAYGSYQALLDDPEVEAVYIPLPNGLHHEWTLRAAAAGKHVLCEKPLARTAAEAAEMAAACRNHGVLLMEAYMTPFHRRMQRVLAHAAEGSLGALRFGRTVFTFPANDPDNHRWLPEMGGGALLDVGCYVLEPLVTAAGGAPVAVAAAQHLVPSGVDASFSGWLNFGDGFTASFGASFEAPEQQLLELVGTEAALTVDTAFTAGINHTSYTIKRRDGATQVLTEPANDSYLTMVEHFAAAVRGEAPLARPPEASIRMLTLMDRLRAAATGGDSAFSTL